MKKFLCLLFGHKWCNWKSNGKPGFVALNTGSYSEKYNRKCDRCGKIQEKFFKIR